MTDDTKDPEGTGFPPDLSELPRKQWLTALRQIGQERGFAEPLGRMHAGIFVEEGDTLVVSFENMSSLESLSDTRTPFCFNMVRDRGWSALAVLSHGDTWFRAPEIYAFFDQLQDDGFFDDFEQVVFYGAGPCGYAAAAYSVASPGARVLALQPQATLDPEMTGWDDRFTDQRHRDFTSRYGYAPEMLDGAQAAFVLYDPRETLDAMHAALFRRPGVTRLGLPSMGGALQADLMSMGILQELLTAVAEDRLDRARFAALYRKRRDHAPYLRRLMALLDQRERTELTRMLCENVISRMHAPRFEQRLARIEEQDELELMAEQTRS